MFTFPQAVISYAGTVALLAVLMGLAAKRRYALCWTFTAYLLAILVVQVLLHVWPERFYNKPFWIVKESVYDALKFGIALELGVRTFRHFPGVLPFVRAAAITVVSITTVALIAVPSAWDLWGHAHQLHPRVINGTIWLMTAVLALALWFRVPMEPLHKAILVGFVPYLFLFSAGLNLIHITEGGFLPLFKYLDPLAYVALLCYWTWAVWQPQEEAVPAGHPLAQALEARG